MTDHYTTILEAAENMADLIKTTEDAVTETAQKQNPDLTVDANRREAEVRMAKVRSESGDWITRKSSAAELAITKAEQSLRTTRPHIDENDVAALVRAEQRWNHQVRPLLDAGQPLKEILKSATVDDLLAIERFAGGWLTVQRLTTDSPLEIEPQELEQAIHNQMVTVLPEDRRAEFEDAVRAQYAGRVFQEVRELAVQSVGGNSPSPLSNWGQAKSKVSRLR